MQIYVHHNNQQLGPFSETDLKAQFLSGAISLQDHVWWQGQASWILLGQTQFAPTSWTPAPGATVAPSSLYPVTEKTSVMALSSMICGISSLLCGFLFIPAIILGHMGLSETSKNPAVKGRGMALTGLIMGYLVFSLIAISIIAMGILMALGNQVKSTFKTISAPLPYVHGQASQDDSDNDQSTNSPDQSTNSATPDKNSSDNSTNSTPAITP